MKPQDESLLSAYLDGQLDPDEQHRLELALFSDARLAEELRSLTAVRELVAGLSRDGSPDVSPRVLERIGGRRSPARAAATLSWPFASARLLGAATLASLAAGLLLAAGLSSLLLLSKPSALHGQFRTHSARVNPAAPASDPAGVATADPAIAGKPALRASQVAARPEPELVANAGRKSKNDATRPTEPRILEDIHRFLDNPDLRRVFLVSDSADGKGAQRVASVIEQSTRYGFLKFTIAQGIVLDPRRPAEATVFALVVDSNELVTLRDRLRKAVEDGMEEEMIDPAVVAQLADIEQVEVCSPAPMGHVRIPREVLALQTSRGTRNEDDRPTLEQERSAPVPPPASGRTALTNLAGTDSAATAVAAEGAQADGPGEGANRSGDSAQRPGGLAALREIPRNPARSDRTVYVLVWVTKDHRS